MSQEEELWTLLQEKSMPVWIGKYRCFLVNHATFKKVKECFGERDLFSIDEITSSGFLNIRLSLMEDVESFFIVTPKAISRGLPVLPFYPSATRLWLELRDRRV